MKPHIYNHYLQHSHSASSPDSLFKSLLIGMENLSSNTTKHNINFTKFPCVYFMITHIHTHADTHTHKHTFDAYILVLSFDVSVSMLQGFVFQLPGQCNFLYFLSVLVIFSYHVAYRISIYSQNVLS